MINGMIGADVHALREMARVLDQASARLLSTRSHITSTVAHTAQWRGADGGRFQQQWTTHGAAYLLDVARELEQAAKLLRANANEQDRASAAIGGPGMRSAGGGGGGGGGGSWGDGDVCTAPGSTSELSYEALHELKKFLDGYIPGTAFTYGDMISKVPGAGDLLKSVDVLDILQDPNINDVARVGKLTQAFATIARSSPNPIVYFSGTAAAIWGYNIEQASKLDLSTQGISDTFTYMAQHPWDSIVAGSESVVAALPDIANNVVNPQVVDVANDVGKGIATGINAVTTGWQGLWGK